LWLERTTKAPGHFTLTDRVESSMNAHQRRKDGYSQGPGASPTNKKSVLPGGPSLPLG
jgi:hypothetical protein